MTGFKKTCILIRKKISSLKVQLIVIITSVCMFVFIGASFSSYNAIFKILSIRTEKDTIVQFQQVEYNVEKFMEDIQKAFSILLNDSNLQDYISEDTNNKVNNTYTGIELVGTLSTILNYYNYINTISVFSEQGKYLSMSREYCTTDNNKKCMFMGTDIYREMLVDYTGYKVVAGTTQSDFFPSDYGATFDKSKLVTFVKGVKSYYIRKNAVVTINVQADYISHLYKKFTEVKNILRMYIITGSGTIIPDDINIASNKYKRITDKLYEGTDTSYGYFTYRNNGQATNIIYYKMKKSNWVLVREIPINEFSEDVISIRKIIIWTFVLSFCIILILAYFWVGRVTRPIVKLSAGMKDVGKGNFGITLPYTPGNEIGHLVKQFNSMSLNILNLIDENRKIEKEKRDQEIKTLQAHINPHFIYNTLNTIKNLALVCGNTKIADSLTIFGNALRPIFKSRSMMYTLSEEIEFLRNYVEILNIRYCNNINLECSIKQEYMNCFIPRFLLQPLVENSVIHGMQESECTGTIYIKLSNKNNDNIIIVSDTGVGITEDRLHHLNEMLDSDTANKYQKTEKIGIYNVNRRIKLYFGKEYGIWIESEKDRGTKVFVKIPAKYAAG